MAEFHGHLLLGAERDATGRTTLARQSFRAPFHLSKPYWDADAGVLMTQVVNPTAGILEGDRLESDVTVGSGAAFLVTTPSASRVFQMNQGEAQGRQQFKVDSGGWLEFMPEPLVPHKGSTYRQTTSIDVVTGGELLFADFLMPGRVARGETWAWSRLCLDLTVRVADQLILRERFDQSGAELKTLAELAGGGDGVCFGNLIVVSPKLEAQGSWRGEIAALHGDGVWLGLSALRGECGGWSLKVIAPDSVAMRRIIAAVRRILSAVLPSLKCDLRKL